MVEFAIVALLFFSLLLGIMDFGRLLFTWNAAAEATRWGARIAVVCDKPTPDQVRSRMKRILPQLADSNIAITYYNPAGVIDKTNSCNIDTCKAVEVSLSGFTFDPISPFIPALTMPDFRTYLLRESMEAVNAANDQNPVCFI